jgi:hypothetical protein
MADNLKQELEATGSADYSRSFLRAETDLLAGNENLSGALHHWDMVIELRQYLFQVSSVY